jgi:integrase
MVTPVTVSGVKSLSMPSPRTKPASGLLTRGCIPTSLVDLLIADLPSPESRRSYAKAIADLYAFARREDGSYQPITAVLLAEWRSSMAGTLSNATVNLRLSAARALVRAAQKRHLIDTDEAWELLQVNGMPFRGTRVGNWLSVEQTKRLLALPARNNLRGLRNACIFAILAGCALRLNELAALETPTFQQRDGRWVLADLPGKGGRVRTVAIPAWVVHAINAWMKAAKIKEGKIIRQLTLAPEGLSPEAIRDIVRKAAAKIGVRNFGPHDLRRTCARLCREHGGDIEQIQAMLGHASLVTTQRYLGTVQNLKNAVNDTMGL